jgi:hypothetical protein
MASQGSYGAPLYAMGQNIGRKRKGPPASQERLFKQYESFARRTAASKARKINSNSQKLAIEAPPSASKPIVSTNPDEEDEDEVEEISRSEIDQAKRPRSILDLEALSPILRHIGHIGSFRGDPFKMYPVKTTPVVTQAIDYFAEYYGPVAIRLPRDKTNQKYTPFFGTYFRTMLHDPMLFELIVALSLGMQRLHLPATARLTPNIVYHIRNVLVQLNQRLSTSEGSSDVVVLTIMGTLHVNVRFPCVIKVLY